MGPKLYTEDEVARIAHAAMTYGYLELRLDDKFEQWWHETRGMGGYAGFRKWLDAQ